MEQDMFQLVIVGQAGEGTTATGGVSMLWVQIGNFLLSVAVLAGPEPFKGFDHDPRTFLCIGDADHNGGGYSVVEQWTPTGCPAGAG